MSGRSINDCELPRGVFESKGNFSSMPLGVIVVHLVGRHIQAADLNGPTTPPEGPLRW